MIMDGGQAFPRGGEYVEGYYTGQEGMSLRAWIAGQAVIGIISAEGETRTPARIVADRAYEIADAMIAKELEAEKHNVAIRNARYNEDDDRPF